MPLRRLLSGSRPSRRATAQLAIAGIVALSAVPVGVLVTTEAPSRLAPVQTAYAAALDSPKSAPPVAADEITGSDGSTLMAKVVRDEKLRRTLQALRTQSLATPPVVVGGTVTDIPAIALSAYRRAAAEQAFIDPSCHVSWSLLAGIGRVESDHGRYGGSKPDANGDVHPAILGPVLDGSGGNAAISDTDGGQYDGNSTWDRAVGPMQFIPSSWATGGRDGNGDGLRDPENLFDAALAAANYLCAAGGDLRTTSAAERAVLTYNHSWDYVLVVLGYAASYANQDLSAITAELAKHLPDAASTASRQPVRRRPVPVPHTSSTAGASTPAVVPTRVSPSPTPSRSSAPAPSPTPTPTPTDQPSGATITPSPSDSSSQSSPAATP
jgi:membrane-bound lytic murein transglycosylase B